VGEAVHCQLDRPTTVTEAVGTPVVRATSFQYDANSNRWEVTDPAGTITRITFDVLNQPAHPHRPAAPGPETAPRA
jgi:YD repeat-containing protein